MSIFGQVWLWSVVAFFVGVLLTWVLLVRPAQARSRALERRLQAAQAAASARQSVPTPPTRTFDAEPEPAPVTEHRRPVEEQPAPPEPKWYDRDSFGERAPERDDSVFDPESAAEKTSIFTSHQASEPEHGSLFAPEDEAAERGALFVHEPEQFDATPERGSLFDAEAAPEPRYRYEPEPERGSLFGQEAEHGSLFGRGAEVEPGSLFAQGAEAEHGSLFGQDLPAERRHRYAPEPEPEPEQSYGSHAAVEEEPPAYAFGGGEPESPVEPEKAAESTAILPRRQPRSTPPSSFEPPRPSMRSIERREPVLDEPGRSGSLFEPAVRPNSAAGAHAVAPEPGPPPPPARAPVSEGGIPPGPFGPGSAMPRPGGGRPSDEFVVKASVTALRYCTDDSPQFGRMVAEVWFRSPDDAERVGFRPLS